MGASIFCPAAAAEADDDESTKNKLVVATTTTTSNNGNQTNGKRRHQKKKTPEAVQEWRRITSEFTAQVLDGEAYLNLPIRSTMVQGAKDYPQTTNHQAATMMPGSHKHLGGAYDATDGCIYGVPANSKCVLCLKYDDGGKDAGGYTMHTIPLPASIRDTKMKWLRGILAHGYLWAIPSWANAVLCVDVDAYWGRRRRGRNNKQQQLLPEEYVQLIPLPPEHAPSEWQWHGAGMNHEKTALFCIPSNAQSVLKVDMMTKTTSLIPIKVDPQQFPNYNVKALNKWYGGITGNDNCVYGIPYRSCGVLQIDCAANTARLIGKDYGANQYNWHGGILVNGKIYAHPSHANTVLVIDTTTKSDQECYELPITRAEYDTDTRQNYKWLGGAVGMDGSTIYCPACDTSSAVLKIDCTTDTCTTFGFAGTEKNKWQGGVLSKQRDGCIYCIPASGRHVLRICTSTGSTGGGGAGTVQLLGDLLSAHKDKWQGGHEGLDGCLYFIPENGYRVLKVIPPMQPPELDDQGKLPTDDVKLELL